MHTYKTLSAGVVEYTSSISAEGARLPNEYPGYDIKPSDSEASALEIWGM